MPFCNIPTLPWSAFTLSQLSIFGAGADLGFATWGGEIGDLGRRIGVRAIKVLSRILTLSPVADLGFASWGGEVGDLGRYIGVKAIKAPSRIQTVYPSPAHTQNYPLIKRWHFILVFRNKKKS